MIPYAPSSVYRPSTRLSELMLRAAEDQAQGHRVSGQIWGNAVANVGDIASGAFRDYSAQKQEQKQAEEMSRRDQAAIQVMSNPESDPMEFIRIYGPKEGIKVAEGFAAFKKIGQGSQSPEDLFKLYGGLSSVSPELRARAYPTIMQSVSKSIPALSGALPPEYSEEGWSEIGKLLGGMNPQEDESVVVGGNLVNKRTGKPIFTAPPEPAKPDSRSLEIRLAEAVASGDTAKATAIESAIKRAAAAGRAPERSGSDNEPLVPVIGDDGQPVLMRRSSAEGRRPASNREQGRPVISGDANRISEYDNSISEATKLKKTMTTGVASKLGTMIPDAITQLTGWGADSKAQEGTINLVKQIIGKGLEGGVLRKEDEIKYAKIIPKIGDPPDVAQAKIDGLIQTLNEKKGFLIDSLEDAGYDVSRYRQRGGSPASKPPDGTKPGPGAKDKKAEDIFDKYDRKNP